MAVELSEVVFKEETETWELNVNDAFSNEEFLSGVYPNITTGDVILFSTPNREGLHRANKSAWDHVGVVYRRNASTLRQFDRVKGKDSKDEVLLLEATAGRGTDTKGDGERISGVDLVSLKDRMENFFNAPASEDGNRFIGLRRLRNVTLSEFQEKSMEQLYIKYRNHSFNAAGGKSVQTKGACSVGEVELVAHVLQELGVLRNPTTNKKDKSKIAAKEAWEYTLSDFSDNGGKADGLQLEGMAAYTQEVLTFRTAVVTDGKKTGPVGPTSSVGINFVNEISLDKLPQYEKVIQFGWDLFWSDMWRQIAASTFIYVACILSGGLLVVPLVGGYMNAVLVYLHNESGKNRRINYFNMFVYVELIKSRFDIRHVTASFGLMIYLAISVLAGTVTMGIGAVYLMAYALYFIPLTTLKGMDYTEAFQESKRVSEGQNKSSQWLIVAVCFIVCFFTPAMMTVALNAMTATYVVVFHAGHGNHDQPIMASENRYIAKAVSYAEHSERLKRKPAHVSM